MAQVAVTSEPLDLHALTRELVQLKPDNTYSGEKVRLKPDTTYEPDTTYRWERRCSARR